MKILTIFFLVLISFHNLFAQNNASSEYGTWKVWGVVFADYFYKTAGDSSGSSLEYSGYKKDFNSFEFRRVNIGFDYSFNENFDGVISLSMMVRSLRRMEREQYISGMPLSIGRIFLRTPSYPPVSYRLRALQ